MKAKPPGGKTAKAKFRRPPKSTAKPAQSINTQTHPNAAGIDVGAEEFVAAVPIGRCDEPVATIGSPSTML